MLGWLDLKIVCFQPRISFVMKRLGIGDSSRHVESGEFQTLYDWLMQ